MNFSDKKMIFAIDCDEVLRQTLDGMVKLYNEHFGGDKTRDDVTDFVCENSFPEIESATGVSASHWFFQEHSKELFLEAEPFPHIKEDIDRLRKYGKVIILTYQKTYQNKIDTLMWLNRQGIECDGICFSKDKSLIEADYLIDDNEWNFKGCKARNAIIVNAPYNKNVSDVKILADSHNVRTVCRVDSLHEFVDKFEQAHEDYDDAYKLQESGKTYVLKQGIDYWLKNSDVHQFGRVGDSVKITNCYIDGLEAYAVVGLTDTWGSVSVKAKLLNKYIF